MSEDEFDAVNAEVATVLAEAVQFALDSPLEDKSTALLHVFNSN